MENRLQFLHCNKVFSTAEEAKAHIERLVDLGRHRSLYAEPIILKYGDENDPKILIGIGSVGDGTSAGRLNNKYFFVDADAIEGGTEAIEERLDDAIQMLTLSAEDTKTIDLTANVNASGTTILGDVKVAERKIIGETVKPNIIQVTDDGLFSYVGLTYNSQDNTMVLQVNETTTTIDMPAEAHVQSGRYVYTGQDAENIILTLTNGEEVKIDVSKLIEEWDVEGEASQTPIVLKKEHVLDDSTSHVEHWKDILTADVRIIPNELQPNNILEKDATGRYLLVNGTASNISYWKNGTKITVKDALDNMGVDVSTNSGNIICKKNGGLYASTILDYNPTTNTLSFRKTDIDGNITTDSFLLNSVSFVDNVSYDSEHEVIRIAYRTSDGHESYIEIPAKDIIEEWDVDNANTTVTLKKTRNQFGTDQLSAMANISTFENNILKVDNQHNLYVNGVSSEIKYVENNSKTVKEFLDELLDLINGEIARASSADTAMAQQIETISGASSSLQTEVDNIETAAGLTNDGNYTPNSNAEFISGATSLADADNKLDNALSRIYEAVSKMREGGETATAKVYTKNVNGNDVIVADVKLSGGKSMKTQEQMTINTYSSEFTNDNAISIVDSPSLNDNAPEKGVFLSTIWDCGTF